MRTELTFFLAAWGMLICFFMSLSSTLLLLYAVGELPMMWWAQEREI